MARLNYVDPKLKPCPFCGNDLIRVKVRATAIIECSACEALVIRRTLGLAIKTWQTRTRAD